MGRWAQAKRRGGVPPGETVHGFPPPTAVEFPFSASWDVEPTTIVFFYTTTLVSFPAGADHLNYAVKDHTGALLDFGNFAFGDFPSDSGPISPGAGGPFVYTLQWRDASDAPLGPVAGPFPITGP